MLIRAIALAGVLSSCSWALDEVSSLPGFGKPLEPTFSGFLECNASSKGFLYYMMFMAQHGRADAPLVIWLNGGPGASSAVGNLFEHGPYLLNPNGTLRRNPRAWNQDAHIVYIDQPVGTGYSYSDSNGYVTDYDMLASQFYVALKQLRMRHSWLSSLDVYIAGESFAGVYIPKIAAHILRQPDSQNLQGVLIGNPGNLDFKQYESQMDIFKALGLVGDHVLEIARKQWVNCTEIMAAGDTELAFAACEQMSTTLMNAAGQPFIYDLRQWGDVYDEVYAKAMSSYLSNPEVKKALNVPSSVDWKNGDGTAAPNPVVNALRKRLMDPALDELVEILKHGKKVTIFDGVMDGSSCNHLGVFGAVKRMQWDGLADFLQAPRKQWRVESIDHPLGYLQTFNNFTFVWVANSGHLVPIDQPEAADALIKMFLNTTETKVAASNDHASHAYVHLLV
eukprot:TRINITY_DN95783_c0_g1_i1.p1 TRINITY_DN95783_c0_g1~~TRINITY_DN95783_c0_g1_i1.p1  ORF type:complete len:450 (+),score=62.39 TRINITY_DN95783_c0_g1_i1:136-1485(+)